MSGTLDIWILEQSSKYYICIEDRIFGKANLTAFGPKGRGGGTVNALSSADLVESKRREKLRKGYVVANTGRGAGYTPNQSVWTRIESEIRKRIPAGASLSWTKSGNLKVLSGGGSGSEEDENTAKNPTPRKLTKAEKAKRTRQRRKLRDVWI